MIWLFERGAEVVRIETRVDRATGDYVLVSTWTAGDPKIERFRDQAAYQSRIAALEARLASEHWIQVGSPTILPDGWRGPIAN